MKDERLYAKFTLEFATSPKIKPLSDAAFRCLVEATLWSRLHMTDGFLSKRLAIASWGLEVLQELASNDPTNPSLIPTDAGWWIHDFAAHQTTTADLAALREKRSSAGHKGGKASVEARRKQVLKQTASKSKPETETETETEITVVTTVGGVGGVPATTRDAVPAPRAARTGTRLDAAWMPGQEVIDTIKAETGAGTDALRAQHRTFVDYWIAQPGQRGVKVDWNATWRNWMRRAAQRGELGGGAVQPKVAPTDARVARVQALKAQYINNNQQPKELLA